MQLFRSVSTHPHPDGYVLIITNRTAPQKSQNTVLAPYSLVLSSTSSSHQCHRYSLQSIGANMTTSSDTSIVDRHESLTDGQQPVANSDTLTNGIATNTTSSSNTPPPGPPNKAKSLSCGTCRERKVRCDKNQPCSTCQRAKVPCIFPSAKRLPRKRQGERKKTNEKLLQRLNRLEALVEKAGLDEKDGQKVDKKKESSGCTTSHSSPEKLSNGDVPRKNRERSETSQSSGSQPGGGKTALEGEMSRYLGSNFWANLSDEVKTYGWRT